MSSLRSREVLEFDIRYPRRDPMRLFIRCTATRTGRDSSTRNEQLAALVRSPELIRCAGMQWFHTARSRSAALSRLVEADDVASGNAWRTKTFIDPERTRTLSLWNGRDDSQAASLSATVFEHGTMPDSVVIEFPIGEASIEWLSILEANRCVAIALCGVALVSSIVLMDSCRELLPERDRINAAYATYWAEDPSGRNPRYAHLAAAGLAPPCEVVTCAGWDEVSSPDVARVAKVAALVG